MGCSWEIQTETVQMHDPILKLLLLFESFCFVIHIFFLQRCRAESKMTVLVIE